MLPFQHDRGVRGRGRGNLQPGRQRPEASEAPGMEPQHRQAPGGDEPQPESRVVIVAPGGGGAEAAGTGVDRGRAAQQLPAPEGRKMRGNRRGTDYSVVTRTPGAPSKHGTKGTQLTLTANYFRLKRSEQHVIFQYHVSLVPPVEDARVRATLIRAQGSVIGPYIFDGTQLFLYNKLRSEEVELAVKDPLGSGLYKMTIRRVGTVSMTSEKALSLLNLMHRQAMATLKLKQVRRHFFDPSEKILLTRYGIELYPGYATSVRQHEQHVLLSVQLTHRVICVDKVYRMYQDMASRVGGSLQADFKRAVVGMVVMTVYNHKTYVVSDVDFETTPLSSFTRSDGKTISFMQYFRDTYGVQIADPHQPMLVSEPGMKQRRKGFTGVLMLVPELCRQTGVTNEMRRNHSLMAAIASHTRIGVDQRIERLTRFNNRLIESPETRDMMSYWKTELDRRLVEVPARQLAMEKVLFAPTGTPFQVGPTADWSAAFRSNHMYRSQSLTNWCAVCPSEDQTLLRGFINYLITVAKGIGLRIVFPQIAVTSGTDYIDVLRSALNRDPQLVLCLVPNERADRYTAIKRLCCVDRAVPTQVLRLRTIQPRRDDPNTLRPIATKLAIQLNSKLGGVPWIVANPLSSVMVVGFDVYHDTSKVCGSYGALVATMFARDGGPEPRFFSCVEPHEAGVELSSFIATGITKALRSYQQQFGTGALPLRIIIYRDGVGEGQLHHVVQHEVAAIRECLQRHTAAARAASNAAAPAIRLTFVVVTKRINTRLFLGGTNPPPCTIVDDLITHPERNDFFLISQYTRHGTVSPTAYNVLYDESGLTVDQLQAYTAKQTHLYYNWCGTISVPAVCQYAHKLATLAGQYLQQAPQMRLDNSLYFL